MRYDEFENIKEKLLFKKIITWGTSGMMLDDGTTMTIECSEQDCCASAGGEFKEVVLDAVITDVKLGEKTSEEDDMRTNYVTVTIFHNQNQIALADCYADNGNGGYYYSICSFVIGDVHYPVVEA